MKKSQIPKAKKDSSSGRLIFDGALFDYLQEALDPEDEVIHIYFFELQRNMLNCDLFFSFQFLYIFFSFVVIPTRLPKYIISRIIVVISF